MGIQALIRALLLASATLTVPGFAAETDEHRAVSFQREVGGWEIAGDPAANGCVAQRLLPSQTDIAISLIGSQETIRFSISNPSWKSLADGDIRLSAIFFSRDVKPTDYWSLDAVGIAENNGGPRLYFDILRAKNDGANFLQQFQRASSIGFARGEVPIARVDLAGSSAALDALLECRHQIRNAASYDPFAR